MSRAKRRKLSKLNALAAFETLDRVTSETPEGTSRTESLDGVYEPSQHRGTSETPEGTSRSSIAPSSVQAQSVSVEIDSRELEIPYDMIIGRPSICEHKLLRFDAELSHAGSETLISRQTQPPLTSDEAPPLAPAKSVEAGLKGLTQQNPEMGTTDRNSSTDCDLELLWVISER